jgi:hypothetical protein
MRQGGPFQRIEGGFGFVAQGEGLGGLFAEAIDNVRRGLGHEGFVGELTLAGGEVLLMFGELFGEALALGRDVDLALVEYSYVEGRVVALTAEKMRIGAASFSGTPISLRSARMVTISCWRVSISATAALSAG